MDKGLINNGGQASRGYARLTALVQQAIVPRARRCRKKAEHLVQGVANLRQRRNYENQCGGSMTGLSFAGEAGSDRYASTEGRLPGSARSC